MGINKTYRLVMLVMVFAAILSLAPVASGQTIQDALDLAESQGGGEIMIGCGTFTEAVLLVPDNVALIGSGHCTIIPPVVGKYSGERRMYGIRIEHLVIDGNLAGGYIGIDFRNMTNGIIRNVIVRNVQTGVLLAYASLYNLAEHVFTCASMDGFEVYAGANQNTIVGGKADCGQVGIWIWDSNGTTVIGTALENTPECLRITGEWAGTHLYGVRCENQNGTSWWP